MSAIILKSKEESRLKNGHLWVFSNEIARAEGEILPGTIVDVLSSKREFLGRGFCNPHSLIACRLLTCKDEKIDESFFEKRLSDAVKMRESLYPSEKSYRMVFGESDFLPGLVIDRYEDHFAVRSYCKGMDDLTPLVVDALKTKFAPKSIVLKNDSSLRQLENLPLEVKVTHGEISGPAEISQRFGEQTLKFRADLVHGQKSGFYFDQRENRELFASWCKDKRVLDCFSYTGAFGIYAASAGAKEVVCVESGKEAAARLEENAKLNKVSPQIINGDSFETLTRFRAEEKKFDIMVLDPPAFAKSRKNVFSALRKYQQLNELAIPLLTDGGILFSCSCSHHVGRKEFLEMIGRSAAHCKRDARVLEIRGQSRDHPIHPCMPETEYLKCAVVKVN